MRAVLSITAPDQAYLPGRIADLRERRAQAVVIPSAGIVPEFRR